MICLPEGLAGWRHCVNRVSYFENPQQVEHPTPAGTHTLGNNHHTFPEGDMIFDGLSRI